jgi:Zinc finger C-x8-C-x5-C-x3-H type (and similar)
MSFFDDFDDFDPTVIPSPSPPKFDPLFLDSQSQEEESFSPDMDYIDPTAILESVLTNLSKDEIQQALMKNNYSIDATLDALLADKPLDNPEKPSKQVCRHFLLGQCYRSDCWFSHDPEMLICKFFLRGTCYKGNECEFSHGEQMKQIINERLDDSKAAMDNMASLSIKDAFPSLAKDDFPSLKESGSGLKKGGSKKSVNKKAGSNASSAKGSLTNVGAIGQSGIIDFQAGIKTSGTSFSPRSSSSRDLNPPGLVHDFPPIGYKPENQAIGQPLKPSTMDFWSPPTSAYSNSVKTVAPPVSTQDRYVQQQQAQRQAQQSQQRREKIDVKWVSTGSNVESSYFEYRDEAIQAAIQRNKLCQQY